MLTHDWIQGRNIILLCRIEVTSSHFQGAPKSFPSHVSPRLRSPVEESLITNRNTTNICLLKIWDRQIIYWIQQLLQTWWLEFTGIYRVIYWGMILVTWFGEVSWGGIARDDIEYFKKVLPQSSLLSTAYDHSRLWLLYQLLSKLKKLCFA